MAFRTRPVTIEQLERIPKDSSWDLPRNEVYVQLGCRGCANQVCLVAKGMLSQVPEFSGNPEATQVFNDLTREVEHGRTIHRGSMSLWEDPCNETECPEQDSIETVVELLNEHFGSALQVPTKQGE